MVVLDALTGMSVLCAAVFLSGDNVVVVISVLLVVLSVLGAFETPTVQACIPQMLAGGVKGWLFDEKKRREVRDGQINKH